MSFIASSFFAPFLVAGGGVNVPLMRTYLTRRSEGIAFSAVMIFGSHQGDFNDLTDTQVGLLDRDLQIRQKDLPDPISVLVDAVGPPPLATGSYAGSWVGTSSVNLIVKRSLRPQRVSSSPDRMRVGPEILRPPRIVPFFEATSWTSQLPSR